MSITSIIGDNTLLIAVGLIGTFVLWKFVLQPIANEDRPIEPDEEDIKTFSEKMQESMEPSTNI